MTNPNEQTEDEILSSIWDKMHAAADEPEAAVEETPVDPTPGAAETPAAARDEKGRFAAKGEPEAATAEQASAAVAAPAQKDATTEKPAATAEQPPSEIPRALAQHWGAIPEAARTALVADRQKLANAAAEAGRVAAPYRAIHDRLGERFPEVRGWTPEQLEERVTQIATYERALAANPAQTLLATARDLGVLPQMRHALGGAGATEAEKVLPGLVAEIKALREQVAGMPATFERRTQAATAEGEVNATISQFKASCGEEWDVLEPTLTAFVTRVRAENPGASAMDVLKEAYEQAAWAHPVTRSTRIAAAQPPAPTAASASARQVASQAARAAAIPGRGAAGSEAPISIDASLRATYDRMANS